MTISPHPSMVSLDVKLRRKQLVQILKVINFPILVILIRLCYQLFCSKEMMSIYHKRFPILRIWYNIETQKLNKLLINLLKRKLVKKNFWRNRLKTCILTLRIWKTIVDSDVYLRIISMVSLVVLIPKKNLLDMNLLLCPILISCFHMEIIKKEINLLLQTSTKSVIISMINKRHNSLRSCN